MSDGARVYYELMIGDEARDQLRALPKIVRRHVGHRLDLLQENLVGEVKKLSNREQKYRLRVGTYRVLFERREELFSCML